jgi:hypothetical protein
MAWSWKQLAGSGQPVAVPGMALATHHTPYSTTKNNDFSTQTTTSQAQTIYHTTRRRLKCTSYTYGLVMETASRQWAACSSTWYGIGYTPHTLQYHQKQRLFNTNQHLPSTDNIPHHQETAQMHFLYLWLDHGNS